MPGGDSTEFSNRISIVAELAKRFSTTVILTVSKSLSFEPSLLLLYAAHASALAPSPSFM